MTVIRRVVSTSVCLALSRRSATLTSRFVKNARPKRDNRQTIFASIVPKNVLHELASMDSQAGVATRVFISKAIFLRERHASVLPRIVTVKSSAVHELWLKGWYGVAHQMNET
jgi:hypothetical protein